MGRRRFTRAPGYHSVLPRVFPFKREISLEEASSLIVFLVQEEHTGYALSRHPSTLDGHVTFWMSNEIAEILVGGGHLSYVEETEPV